MPCLVIAAEVATAAYFIIFCLMIASDVIRGQVFDIQTRDPVGRCLLRHAQLAFVIGYSTFTASTIAIAFGLL